MRRVSNALRCRGNGILDPLRVGRSGVGRIPRDAENLAAGVVDPGRVAVVAVMIEPLHVAFGKTKPRIQVCMGCGYRHRRSPVGRFGGGGLCMV